jgi:hypothetical protein
MQDDTSYEETLKAIAGKVSSGGCILFLGAGIHCPSPPNATLSYAEPICPPLGAGLARMMDVETHFSKRFPKEGLGNLQRVAMDYEIKKQNRGPLIQLIRAAVHNGKQPSPLLLLLASLPFSIIITTNYDQLLEQALSIVGKQPVKSIYKPSYNAPERADPYPDGEPTPQQPFVLKMHGDIDKPESIVITDDDYIRFVSRMCAPGGFHPIPLAIQYHLATKPMLFIGYSLMDFNLRTLFMTLRWSLDQAFIPASYSVDPSPDKLAVAVYQNKHGYLQYIVKDAWNFVPDLHREVKT